MRESREGRAHKRKRPRGVSREGVEMSTIPLRRRTAYGGPSAQSTQGCDQLVRRRLTFPSNWNTCSRGSSNAPAIRNAVSRDGEYLPSSIAFSVWRVTPTTWASSCCVISSCSNLRRRIWLLMGQSLMPCPVGAGEPRCSTSQAGRVRTQAERRERDPVRSHRDGSSRSQGVLRSSGCSRPLGRLSTQ